jgi:ABC-type multidrug transport system ATPase subunit
VAEPLVLAESLTKRFPGATAPAVDRLTACIEAGRVTGLVGPDGAGKTTLLRLFDGLLLPTDGTVTVCGFDTRTQLAPIREAVSYMPQRFGLYEDLTVRENLDLYSDLRGVVGPEREEAYRQLLDFTGLVPFTGRLAGKLSGGMKQKLGLACALIRAPRLLLLDEPSVGVDPISRRELWRMVYDLADRGIGVVWSTAYLDEAERCASVITLSEGKVLHAGPPGEMTDHLRGRTFLVRGAENRRRVLAAALKRPEVVDGVVQGSSVRVVVKAGAGPPDAAAMGAAGAEVVETPPRFEDAVVDLLGGARKDEGGRMKDESENRPSSIHPSSFIPHPSEDTVVEADGLTKRFGDFTAVDRVSFRIGRGEIFGLLGPNGAGKSTTFKMLCGLLRPTAGSARVAGYDLYRAGGAARANLGYMAQKFSLYGDLSGRQNMNFFAGVYGLTGDRRRAAVDRLSTALGLGPYLDANAGQLPLGFKQRLALACAVLHDPPVLFLDEPTSGVDPLTRREFWAHINAMVERGVTVLVTTHFLDEAEYCDRIGLVYKGKVIAHGSPDELKEQARSPDRLEPTLEDAFISLVEAFDRGEGEP